MKFVFIHDGQFFGFSLPRHRKTCVFPESCGSKEPPELGGGPCPACRDNAHWDKLAADIAEADAQWVDGLTTTSERNNWVAHRLLQECVEPIDVRELVYATKRATKDKREKGTLSVQMMSPISSFKGRQDPPEHPSEQGMESNQQETLTVEPVDPLTGTGD